MLNIQLETGGKTYRDYYIDLGFRGPKTVVLGVPRTGRMLAEFRPAIANYSFKTAMYSFTYGNVAALDLRWMRYSAGSGVRCRVSLVKALEEREAEGRGDLGRRAEYRDSWCNADGRLCRVLGQEPIRIFDRNGILLRTAPGNHWPVLRAGENKLAVKAVGSGDVTFTSIVLGK